MPSGSRAEMVLVAPSIASASPVTVTAEGFAHVPHAKPDVFRLPWLIAYTRCAPVAPVTLITLGATGTSCLSAGGLPDMAAIAFRPCSTTYCDPVTTSELIGAAPVSSVLVPTWLDCSDVEMGTVLMVPSQFSL